MAYKTNIITHNINNTVLFYRMFHQYICTASYVSQFRLMGNMVTYAFTCIQFHLFSIHLKRQVICISAENLNCLSFTAVSMIKFNANSEVSASHCREQCPWALALQMLPLNHDRHKWIGLNGYWYLFLLPLKKLNFVLLYWSVSSPLRGEDEYPHMLLVEADGV